MVQRRLPSDEEYSTLFWDSFESTAEQRGDPGRRLAAFRLQLAKQLTEAGFPSLPEGWLTPADAFVAPDLLRAVQFALERNERRLLSYKGKTTTEFDGVALLERNGGRCGVGTLFSTTWSLISAAHVVNCSQDALFDRAPTVRFCGERVFPGRDVAIAHLPEAASSSPLEIASAGDIDAAQEGMVISYAGVAEPFGRQRIQVLVSRSDDRVLAVATGATEFALLGPRDSGCPLLVVSGGGWRLAGVMVRTDAVNTGVFEVLDDSLQQSVQGSLQPSPGCP